ncbi:MAG: pyridoxal-phosphate dependent enzyme [Cyanobacteria bacterium J06632_22]
MSQTPPSKDAISHAYGEIDPIFLNTPQFELDALNAALGNRIVLKVETLNPIRSFKGRGANYFVQQRAGEAPFVCASAGNFGQGMAYACRQHQIPLTVFAAKTANPLKLDRMRQLGAEVRLYGKDFDVAKQAAKTFASDNNQTFVEDGRDAEVTIGAGTIGLELSRYPALLDVLLVPIGNGALINGVGTWFKAVHPTTRVIGIVAAGAPAMDRSWRQNRVITTETVDTVADGIGVRIPVPEALETMTTTVDDILQVSDDTILAAMQLAHELLGIVLEPAGAVGLAAAMLHRESFARQILGSVLCGSNLTAKQMKQWL